MRVLGPYFIPDRQGRASLDEVDEALRDAQQGVRAAAVVVERDDGMYTYVSPRLSTRRRHALLDALYRHLTTSS